MPFQPFWSTRMLKVRFWPFLDHFGPFWVLLGQNLGHPRTDTLPTVPKPQPGCPVTRSMPFQLVETTRVLKVIFWPFLDHFGPFWALMGQNLGHPQHRHTPKWAKTSTRTSCNLFHAVPTILDHRSAPARALKPTRIIGHKKGHFG